MLLDIIGTGEAYDRYRTNASVIVSEGDYQLLIDCGPTVPQTIWRREMSPDCIDAIYFTHIHPDHASGLTALLNRWAADHRQKPLEIFCHPKQQSYLELLAEYADWPKSLPFTIEWRDATTSKALGPWQMRTAKTRHSISNLALRLDSKPIGNQPAGSLYYSGDGRPTSGSTDLMAGATVAMQECFGADDLGDKSLHGDLPGCLKLRSEVDVITLLLYHIKYACHGRVESQTNHLNSVSVPEDGEKWCCITGQKPDITDAKNAG